MPTTVDDCSEQYDFPDAAECLLPCACACVAVCVPATSRTARERRTMANGRPSAECVNAARFGRCSCVHDAKREKIEIDSGGTVTSAASAARNKNFCSGERLAMCELISFFFVCFQPRHALTWRPAAESEYAFFCSPHIPGSITDCHAGNERKCGDTSID